MKFNDQFIKWYKQKFSEFMQNPPADAWNIISDKLDIEEVWNKVDTELTSIRYRRVKTRITFAALSSLIVIGSFLFFINSKSNSVLTAYKRMNISIPKYSAENTVRNTLPATHYNILENTLKQQESFTSDKTNLPTISETSNQLLSSSNSNIFHFESVKDSSILFNDKRDFASTNNTFSPPELINTFPTIAIDLDSGYYNKPMLNILELNSNEPNNKNEKNNTFYIGGIFSLNNTWLLNNTTIRGIIGNTLDQTKISLNNSFGLSAGYSFNSKWSAELNMRLNSQQDQSYFVYNEGLFLSKQISLNYSRFNISLKHKNADYCTWLNLPFTRNLVTGINIAFLKDGKEVIGETTKQISSYYLKRDLGIRLGYEYEFILYNRLLASPAVLCDFGLLNSFKGNEVVPEYFNRTHNGALTLNFGLKYLLKQ